MQTIDQLPENIASYAMHLIRFRTPRELHQLIGATEADHEVMHDWKLSEDDYFLAIEVAYFAPQEINTVTH